MKRLAFHFSLNRLLADAPIVRKLAQRAWFARLLFMLGIGGPQRCTVTNRAEYDGYRNRRFRSYSLGIHGAVIIGSLINFYGCRHEVPAGVPSGKGDDKKKGKVVQITMPKVIRRLKKIRKSPISIFEHVKELDEELEKQTRKNFSDSMGNPNAIGSNAAAGSPHGSAVGGKLYFYRLRHKGRDWNGNKGGVAPLMNYVRRAGVVKEISTFNNAITMKDLPKHSGKYLPNLIYLTGTDQVRSSKEDRDNLRQYLMAGGMLFVDNSGGNFDHHFRRFIQQVFPEDEYRLSPIENDHEIYRGQSMPYAMTGGCPVYRRHRGAGAAQGIFIGNRLSVFYSTGDLGAAWVAGGGSEHNARAVEQAYRMGVNIITYSLIYYKSGASQPEGGEG